MSTDVNAAATPAARQGKSRRTATILLGTALFMLGLGFASVPLYRIFCQVTGYGGTTQRATEAQLAALADPDAGATRTVSVRFDSNVAPGLAWQFRPEVRSMTVKVGAKNMAVFLAKNTSDKPITGQAAFNVTPNQAGPYFTKIQCFCFTEQTLQPGEEVRMPVLFFVDRKFLDDPDDKDVEEITLSYTFYPVEKPDQQG
ncbi:MAG TPA: cytochrome c oxidase assembly protein [Sphingobium sp.]|nr:cytochrome c oxidase assembly protein [Sphingobium sp.]